MNIFRAEHLGMCFGVTDAIKQAIQTARETNVTVLGDLVHNQDVLERLRQAGVRFAQSAASADTSTVMITAHGASAKAIGAARSAGKHVLEGTCPLVHAAHRALTMLVSEGRHPVIVGKRDHVEVCGMTEDLSEYDVILTEAEVFELQARAKFGVIAQTTQPVERVRRLVAMLRWRFPESDVRFIDTVCQPTKARQNAAAELARRVEAVVVVGGAHSNNTRELARTCSAHCARVFQVENASELKCEWFKGVQSVGVTAGTSTPDHIIDEVEGRLAVFAAEPVCAGLQLAVP